MEVATQPPLPGVAFGDLPKEALRSKAPPLNNPPPGPPSRRSVAEQLGSRITSIRVVWYDTNRVESAAEAKSLIQAWWQEPTGPIMDSFRWANGFWGSKLIHAEVRESDGSVGWLLIENGFPSARASWKDGAGHWRFTHHAHTRSLLLASERPERLLPQLASANADTLVTLLTKLAAVGQGDEQVGRGVIPYLHHSQANVRVAALSAVAAARQPTHLVFDALNEGLRDPDPAVRSAVLWSLLRDQGRAPVDPRFLPAVLATLEDADESVRGVACRTAGQLGREGNAEVAHRVVERLAPLLHDQNAGVRMSAASGMSTLWENGREAIPVLAALPPDPDKNVRNAVTSALRSLREVHQKPIEGVDVLFGVPIPKP